MSMFFQSGSKEQDRLRDLIRKRQEDRYINQELRCPYPKTVYLHYLFENCAGFGVRMLSESRRQFSNERRIFCGQDFWESSRPNVRRVCVLELRVGIRIMTIQPGRLTLTPAS